LDLNGARKKNESLAISAQLEAFTIKKAYKIIEDVF
jgi:hypothetical protein